MLVPSESEKSSASVSSSSSGKGTSYEESSTLGLFDWVEIPESSITRGVNSFGVNSFSMASTEVTQEVYEQIMGELPKQFKDGEKRAVVNVNWYQAALFCNAFSKLAGLDTAYVYTSVGRDYILENLEIDYSVSSVRLPTENEWEIAARGKTTTTYYWNVDEASKYAYYGQSYGPDEVAQKIPNKFGLYDMAGNAAEWVNDWYETYPKTKIDNYVGPSRGDYRVVRGGGWTDKVTSTAPKVREKMDPALSKMTVGFRLVYSTGF